MNSQLSAKFTLWCSRVLFIIICLLTFAMPGLLRWYQNLRPLGRYGAAAIMIGFYCCAPAVLYALSCMERLVRNILAQDVFVTRNVRYLLVLRGGERHLPACRVLLPAPDFHDDDHGVSGAGGERGEERHGRRGGNPGRKRSDGVRRRMAIIVNLDMMLAKRKMTSLELANRVGMTPANLSILKTGKAKAVRMSTMDAICRELQCQPGDLFEFVQDDDPWKR